MKTQRTLLTIVLLVSLSCSHGYGEVKDSVRVVKTDKPYVMRLTTRLSSKGLFSYGGRIVSNNPALDFNFVYERKEFGFMYFKAFDLRNSGTDNNFSLALFYKNFKLSKRLTITPYAGAVLEQTQKIAGKGSDFAMIVTSAFKLNSHFTAEHTALLSNLAFERSTFDWVNRFRLLYTHQHIDLAGIVWHNNKVFDHTEYITYGFNAMYSRMKVTDHFFINAGLTAVYMPYSNDVATYPKRNGVDLILAAVIH